MKVYIHQIVKDIRDALQPGLSFIDGDLTVYDYIHQVGEVLWDRYQESDQRVLQVFNNYHPSYIGLSWLDLLDAELSKSDVLASCAYYFGYSSLGDVPKAELDKDFESAVNLLLTGDLTNIIELLERTPELISRRSQYGHHAMLWHYLGSNGVELHRQVVPLNLPEIISALLRLGVNPSETFSVYKGQHTLKQMIETSAHPRAVGVLDKALDALLNEI